MQDDSPRRSIEALLGHAQFVRGVARALLSDEDRAADLEQDAWVAAVERPPEREPRGWFRAVLRNLRAKALRGGERRARREQGAARPESLPAAADLAARQETLRGVMEAVLALDTHHREVVLLRFYEDLPPRAIAERLGVPVNTVRSRLGRALADLRARLDARHGGRRDAWALSVACLAGVPGDSVPGGMGTAASAAAAGAIMGAKAKAFTAAAALLLLAGGAGWWAIREETEAAKPEGTMVATAAPRAGAPESGIPDAAAPVVPLPAPSPTANADPSASSVTVEGIVVDADDRPVSGAEVTLKTPDPETRVYRDSKSTTGDDGKFRFTTRETHGALLARKAGWAPAIPAELDEQAGAMRWVRLVLPGLEGVVEGTVQGPDGNPLALVTVRVGPPDELLRGRPAWWAQRSPEVETDGAGRFRVAGLPAGSTEVLARALQYPPQFRQVDVEPGKSTRVEIRLNPPSSLAGTVRLPDGSPAAGVSLEVVSYLGCPMGAKTDAEGKYRIQGLWAGKVEVRASGRERGHAHATLTTEADRETTWDPVLSIDPSIRGRVLDEEGRPLVGWWVEAKGGAWDSVGSPESIRIWQTGVDGSFALQNLVTASYSLWAKSTQHGVPSVILKDVVLGGDPVEIRVPADSLPTAGLRGRLRNADGSTPPEAAVNLWPGPERGSPYVLAGAKYDPATAEFRTEGVPAGRYEISVWAKTGGKCFLPSVVLEPRKVLDLGEVILQPPGRIRITLGGNLPRDPGAESVLTLQAHTPDGAWLPAGRHELRSGAPAPEISIGGGEVRLRLSGSWIVPWESAIQVPVGGEIAVEVPVRRAPMRFLRLQGPGLPKGAPWVHVKIQDREGMVHQELRWGRNEAGEIVGYAFLLPGSYQIELTPEGMETVRKSVMIGEGRGEKHEDAIPIDIP